MGPSIPARRAYLAFQVLVACSARALARVSWSSFGRRLRMRVPRAEVVHLSWTGQAWQSGRAN